MVAENDVFRLLDDAVAGLDADAIAAGVVVDDAVEFVCRGHLGDEDVGRQTIFYAASVTKQFLGMLLARAVADRAAATDDLLLSWLPELPHWMAAVRLHHLIHHTSDLPDVADPGLGIPRSNADVIERFRRLRPNPDLQPGVRYAYNNAGYVLLVEVLSRILGQPITDVASTHLFTPLGLTHTRLGGDPVRLPATPDPPRTIGDGGLWISIADLITWLRACNQSRFGADTQLLAESTSRLCDGTPVDYAWGVRVTPTPRGRLITHGGSWQTWLAKTARIPEQGVAVAILSTRASEQAISDIGSSLAKTLAAS